MDPSTGAARYGRLGRLPTWTGAAKLVEVAALVGQPGGLWDEFSDVSLNLSEGQALQDAPNRLVAFCREHEPSRFAFHLRHARETPVEVSAARQVLRDLERRQDILTARLDDRLRDLLAPADYRFLGVRGGHLADPVPARLARTLHFDYLRNRIVLPAPGSGAPETWEHVTVECLVRDPPQDDGAPDRALTDWAGRVCEAVHGTGKRITRDTFIGLALSRFGGGLTVDRMTAAWTRARATTDWPASGSIPHRLRIADDALRELLKSKGLLHKP